MNFSNKVLFQAGKTNGLVITGYRLYAGLLMLLVSLAIINCSGGDVPATVDPSLTPANQVFISPSKTSLLADNLDSVTLTATVIIDNIAQPDVLVTFSPTGGALDLGEATTDASGEAIVTIKAGPNAINQIVTITASVEGGTASTNIQILGNDISLVIPQTNLGLNTSQTISATVTNPIPQGISQAPVTFTVLFESSPGVVSLASSEIIADIDGLAEVVVTAGPVAGTATIQASSMGASAQITITVAAAAQVFEIISPTVDPSSLATNGSLIVSVNAPDQTQVKFNTTLGLWNLLSTNEIINVMSEDLNSNGVLDLGEDTNLNGVLDLSVATATLTSSLAGTANIQVYDPDPNNFATSDTLQVNFFAPASQAAKISLLASQTNLPPSLGDSKNSVTLTATVTTLDDQVVGNAIVNFTITNPTGGGEQITPVSVQTDGSGVATTTFFSGDLSTDSGGLTIWATIDGSITTDFIDLIIGGTAGSIVLGGSTELIPSDDGTHYTQYITAQASDSNGNPVAVETVFSLNLRPTHYHLGFIIGDGTKCTGWFYNDWPHCSGIVDLPNEDLNLNLILDLGEDIGPYDPMLGTMAADGHLTPANASAGTIPATVTTDTEGFASFPISYLKDFGLWTRVELKATGMVLGTETQASLIFELEVTKEDLESCVLSNSPYNYYATNFDITARAGFDRTVTLPALVQLDGTESSYDCPPTWNWRFTQIAIGSGLSNADLFNRTTSTPTFTPDVAGDYEIELTISDAFSTSTDSVIISAL